MILILLLTIMVLIISIRYIPVRGIDQHDLYIEDAKILDVRDYNDSYLDEIPGALNIPVAYLKRYFNEIPKDKIFIVASDTIEKNISVRFLRRKGFNVVGYTFINNTREEFCHELWFSNS